MTRLLMAACLFSALLVPAYADDPVRILTEEFPPFNYVEDDRVQGISTRVVEAAFKRAGVEYVLSVCQWRRAVAEVDSSPNTFIYSMARTESREDKYLWVGKLFDRELLLYRHEDRDDLAGLPLEELRHKARPCAIKGDADHEWLLSLEFPEKSIYVLSGVAVSQCPQMVQKKHADLAAINPYSLRFMINAGQVEDVLVPQGCSLKEDGYYLATGLNTDPELVKKLRQAFDRLAEEGLNQGLADDYLRR